MPTAMDTSRPLTTEELLREEAKAIHGYKAEHVDGKSGRELYQELNKLKSAALCLSGGGIRSAAFALGVIQALAVHPRSISRSARGGEVAAQVNKPEKCLLADFHYLSTVSGGGYIGSWLTAWRSRTDFPTVWSNLVGRPVGPDIEPPVIGWLRSYSNYLTPKTGLMSADAWATGAIYFGNLILNWLLILPIVCTIILAFKLSTLALVGILTSPLTRWHVASGMIAVVCFIIAQRFTLISRPSRQGETTNTSVTKTSGQRTFLLQNLLMSCVASFALTLFLCSDYVVKLVTTKNAADIYTDKGAYSALAVIGIGAIVAALLFAASWIAAERFVIRRNGRKRTDFAAWTASGLVCGAIVGFGFSLYLLFRTSSHEIELLKSQFFWLAVGMPWILLSQVIAEMIFVGLISYHEHSDQDREWFGRAGGWKLGTATIYSIAIVLTYPTVANDLYLYAAKQLAWLLPIAGLLALIVALVAWSGLSPAQGPGKNILERAANRAVTIAAPLFAAALVSVLALAIDLLVFGTSGVEKGAAEKPPQGAPSLLEWRDLIFPSMGALAFAMVGLLASLFININQSSLHAVYRNRLVRAFLGASRERTPDPFTGFDPQDNPRMHTLWPPRNAGWQPFHVINMTLNIVSTERLAWQERKAAPFTVSPLHCGTGSKLDNSSAGKGYGRPIGAYRTSLLYGGKDDDPERSGITLGTAMAISGAAASPNMGYHSSPAVTFLMTMFNVRLGWWLGNPGPEGEQTYSLNGPRTAIVPLYRELFGLTTDDQDYIYLSDGGHFENLGLYEMVRRRCRFIVVVDAGCDPLFELTDLGNAVRKIEIDLGVPIVFSKLDAICKRPQLGQDIECDYYAIGEVGYRTADGGGENGIILYIKPNYHGHESAGIRSYAMTNRDFPHQTTADQNFSESQFESYRVLGFEIADGVFTRALKDKSRRGDPNLASLLNVLRKMADIVPTAANALP